MNLIGNNFGGISPLYARPQFPVQKEIQTPAVPTPTTAPETGESVTFSQAAAAPTALPSFAPEIPAAPSQEQFIAAPPRQNPENVLAGSGIIAGHQSGSLLMMDEPVTPAGEISDHNVGFTSVEQLKQFRGLAQALAASDSAGVGVPEGMKTNRFNTTLNGQQVTIGLSSYDGVVDVNLSGRIADDGHGLAPGSDGPLDFKKFGHSEMPDDPSSVTLPNGQNVDMEWSTPRNTGATLTYSFSQDDLKALVNYGRQLNDAAV